MLEYSVTIPNMLVNAVIVGRVTKDAEARFTPSGAKVANVSVAFSRRWMDEKAAEGQQWKEETTFINCAVWGDSADRAGRIKKGELVSVEFSVPDLKADGYLKADGTAGSSLKLTRCSISKVAWLPTNDAVATEAGDETYPAASVNTPAVTF